MPPVKASRRIRDSNSGSALDIVGQCFAEDGVLVRGFDHFLRHGDHRPVTGHVGCYSVMVQRRGETTLLADPVGQFPLFYVRSGACSAEVGDLGGEVDRLYLATRLAGLESAGLLENRTIYQGVRRVREGHEVHIRAGGVEERPCNPLRVDPDVTLADAAEMLRESLTAAVRARALAADRLTSDFSGGLDSTSLAFLALNDVADLPVFTHSNLESSVGDDLKPARQYVESERRFTQHLVRVSDEHLPYQSLVSMGGEPHPASITCGPTRLRLSAAAAFGADIHLMGEGGDSVLWAPPAYLIDLARRGDLETLWRHCFAWARLRNRSPLSLFKRAMAMAGQGRRRALLRLATTLERGRLAGDTPWEVSVVAHWQTPQVHWLTPPTRRLLAEQARRAADQASDMDAGNCLVLSYLRLHGLTQRVHREAGEKVGVAVHAPFLDTAVVRAALAVPAHRRADPAVAKPLLKKALSGLVPDRVLARTTKGDYSREVYQGIRRAAPGLRKLLTDSAAADFGLIDPVPVRKTLEDAVHGLPVPWGALNQVLAVEVWLRDNAMKVAST